MIARKTKQNSAINMTIQRDVILLESIVFQSNRPLHFDKLDPNSEKYDPSYEQSIKRTEVINVYIIEAILRQRNVDSESFNLLCKIENDFFSGEFYREVIFGRSRANKLKAKKFIRALSRDIRLLNLFEDSIDYAAVIKDMGLVNVPIQFTSLVNSLKNWRDELSNLEWD